VSEGHLAAASFRCVSKADPADPLRFFSDLTSVRLCTRPRMRATQPSARMRLPSWARAQRRGGAREGGKKANEQPTDLRLETYSINHALVPLCGSSMRTDRVAGERQRCESRIGCECGSEGCSSVRVQLIATTHWFGRRTCTGTHHEVKIVIVSGEKRETKKIPFFSSCFFRPTHPRSSEVKVALLEMSSAKCAYIKTEQSQTRCKQKTEQLQSGEDRRRRSGAVLV